MLRLKIIAGDVKRSGVSSSWELLSTVIWDIRTMLIEEKMFIFHHIIDIPAPSPPMFPLRLRPHDICSSLKIKLFGISRRSHPAKFFQYLHIDLYKTYTVVCFFKLMKLWSVLGKRLWDKYILKTAIISLKVAETSQRSAYCSKEHSVLHSWSGPTGKGLGPGESTHLITQYTFSSMCFFFIIDWNILFSLRSKIHFQVLFSFQSKLYIRSPWTKLSYLPFHGIYHIFPSNWTFKLKIKFKVNYLKNKYVLKKPYAWN